MASIRIGFSSDFVLKNGVVGLGTTVGSTTDGKLELDNGALRANLSVSGVATLTAYGGFVAQQQHVNKPAAIGFGTVGVGTHQQYYETTTEFTDLGGVHHGDDQYFNTLSEDLVIDDGQILNITNTDMVGVTTIGEYDPHNHSSYVCAGSLEQVSVTGHFSVPNGGTNDRQLTPIEGTVRFNDDLNTLEFFNGVEWRQFTYNQGQSGRGFFGGGNSPSKESVIDQVNISSLGNATSFGDMTTGMNQAAGTASETRGLLSGGYSQDSVRSDNIDYFTMASSGTAIDFGNLTDGRSHPGGCSSSTRSLIASGYPSPDYTNVIDYVEIATVGNAVDFGDVTLKRDELTGLSSPTRGIFAGGSNPSRQSLIEFVTIASKGDAIDFGNLTRASGYPCGGGNGTRGIVVAGNTPSVTDFIDQITIASTGNAVDFGGTCALALAYRGGSACTKTRMVFGGGSTTQPSTTHSNHIEYITINSNGNGIDFGDLSIARVSPGGLSDSHGGLGGF